MVSRTTRSNLFIGTGLYQFYKVYKGKYHKELDTKEMESKEIKITDKLAKAGLTSRGIAFSIVGYFFIQSAITSDPSKSKGIAQALSFIIQQPFGNFLLMLVGLGFIDYSAFSFINARYNKVEVY